MDRAGERCGESAGYLWKSGVPDRGTTSLRRGRAESYPGEQTAELRDRVIQAALDVAREKYWDVFPFDCLLDLLAKHGMAVTEEAYRETCQMLCIRTELLSEKIYEIYSIIHHNSRERNEYLQKCIAEGYDRCASEEERQQFSEYAGSVSEFLNNTLELQEVDTVCGYLRLTAKEPAPEEQTL